LAFLAQLKFNKLQHQLIKYVFIPALEMLVNGVDYINRLKLRVRQDLYRIKAATV